MTDWENLRFFYAVAEAGSALKAAEQLRVSHATVLRRISKLENDLGVSVFARSAQGHELTEFGEELLACTSAMASAAAEVSDIASKARETASDRLVISCLDSEMVDIMALVQRYSAAYPNVNLTLHTTVAMVDLNRDDIDIAVRMTNHPPKDMIGRKIGHVPWGIFASPDYLASGVDRGDLASLDWVIWRNRDFVIGGSWIDENVGEIRPAITTAKPSEVLNAIRHGMGVGILSHDIGRSNQLVCLCPNIREFDLWVLTHPGSRKKAHVSSFMRLAAEHCSSRDSHSKQ